MPDAPRKLKTAGVPGPKPAGAPTTLLLREAAWKKARMRRALVVGVAVLLAMQLVPVERTSGAGSVDAAGAPPDVTALLRRACGDCHSRATAWPWYGWVAPISWLVAHDVNHGREHLDFSTLSSLAPKKQAKLLGEIAEEVEEAAMPPRLYRLAHAEARLSEAERRVLIDWATRVQDEVVEVPQR
jgi:hypothetical protein